MMRDGVQCIECNAGALGEVTYSDTFNVDGNQFSVAGLKKFACDSCDYSIMTPAQIASNEALIDAARRAAKARYLLAGTEIKALRERLGITQQQASSIFGGGKNAFSKYERGVVLQSEAMDNLLRLVDRYPGLLEDLREFSGAVPAARWTTYSRPHLRIVRSEQSTYTKVATLGLQSDRSHMEWRKCAD